MFSWTFGKPSKEKLQGRKWVKVNGSWFLIKKLNPLLDFEVNNMPQIFTYIVSRRPTDTQVSPQKAEKDMKAVVEAALLDPILVPIGKGELQGEEDGITIDDIFRDMDTAVKLYAIILAHSLNFFKGLRGVFFYHGIKWQLLTQLRKDMVKGQAISPLETKVA